MSLYAFDIVWLVWFVGFILWLVKRTNTKMSGGVERHRAFLNRYLFVASCFSSPQVFLCSTGIGLTLNFYWWLRILQAICACIVSYNVSVSYLRVKQVFFSLL